MTNKKISELIYETIESNKKVMKELNGENYYKCKDIDSILHSILAYHVPIEESYYS